MCGINGFNFNHEELILRMNKKLEHRGPDGQGCFSDQNVSLGHRRLSIIDLTEAGTQPMSLSSDNIIFSEKFNNRNQLDQSLTIVFNGEIYNYLEVKKELQQKGCKFYTDSDTEVILMSYKTWGKDCVKKFNGMWAFVIYDKEQNEFFCSRDRMGVKPLYYYFNGDKFIFSSELKPILEHEDLRINRKENINPKALEFYLYNDFIPAPMTIYKDVYKLESGHSLSFNLETKKIQKKSYYNLPPYKPSLNKKDSIKQINALLGESTKLRMRSDVEVGAFLSGGVDSTAVVSRMRETGTEEGVHTFSVGFDGEYDETEFVKLANQYIKTNHHHKYFKEKDFKNIREIFPLIYDEPFGSASGFPSFFISNKAEKYITVCMSGDGGDEMFGGYNLHGIGRKMDLIYKVPGFLRFIISKIIPRNGMGKYSLSSLKKAFAVSLEPKEMFFENIKDWYLYNPKSVLEWKTDKLKECLGLCNNSLAEALRVFDLRYGTLGDNFLTKVDRASMAASIEVRSPFLDYRFAELSQKIPSELKVSLFSQKYILKKSLNRVLPKSILYRKKQGFTPPILEWINKEEYAHSIQNGAELASSFVPEFKNIFETKIRGHDTDQSAMFKIRLLILSDWYQMYIR